MSMKKNITIDGREVAFKASAAIPRIYRMKFHRDIFKDLRDLEKSIDKLLDGIGNDNVSVCTLLKILNKKLGK